MSEADNDGRLIGAAPDEAMWGKASNLGRLEQRVIHTEGRLTEIKTELKDLNSSIKDLNVSINNMGKPQYQTWAIFGTLFCTVTAGVWWLAIAPIKDDIVRLYSSGHDLAISVDTETKLFDVELKAKLDRAAVDDIRSDMKAKIEALNNKIDELNSARRR